MRRKLPSRSLSITKIWQIASRTGFCGALHAADDSIATARTRLALLKIMTAFSIQAPQDSRRSDHPSVRVPDRSCRPQLRPLRRLPLLAALGLQSRIHESCTSESFPIALLENRRQNARARESCNTRSAPGTMCESPLRSLPVPAEAAPRPPQSRPAADSESPPPAPRSLWGACRETPPLPLDKCFRRRE